MILGRVQSKSITTNGSRRYTRTGGSAVGVFYLSSWQTRAEMTAARGLGGTLTWWQWTQSTANSALRETYPVTVW